MRSWSSGSLSSLSPVLHERAQSQIKLTYSSSACVHDVHLSLWESAFEIVYMHCNTSEHVYLKSATTRCHANIAQNDVN